MFQVFSKKGDRSDPSNYRPISLTCVACNIMESIIIDAVMTYLLDNNLLSNCPVGFVSGYSVQLQHLLLPNHWTDILDSGHTIDVIYMDLEKTLDSVPHIRLLSKLHSHGFRDPLLGRLKSFIIGRRQRVCVHDTVSSWHNVTRSIPQGSVLGYVLFLLYVNNLPDTVASNVYMFADDTKIYRPLPLMKISPFYKMILTVCKVGQPNGFSILVYINATLCLSLTQQNVFMKLLIIT